MIEQVLKCFPQATIRLNIALLELLLQPGLECRHDGTTRVLMVGQAFRGRELLETRRFVMLEDLLEGFNDDGTLRRKGLLQLAELAPTMRQTVAADQRRFIRCITPERIRHDQRLVAAHLPLCQTRLPVLPRTGPP